VPLEGSPCSVHVSIERYRASVVSTRVSARVAGSREIGASGEAGVTADVGKTPGDSIAVGESVDAIGSRDEALRSTGARPQPDEHATNTIDKVSHPRAGFIRTIFPLSVHLRAPDADDMRRRIFVAVTP